jgi:hypothetical protein
MPNNQVHYYPLELFIISGSCLLSAMRHLCLGVIVGGVVGVTEITAVTKKGKRLQIEL